MPTLVTTAVVAERLGVDVRTVHRMVDRGVLTPVAKGDGIRGPYFFDEAELPDAIKAAS